MGTRNIIAIKNEDGVRSVYCQFDGYPEYNGVVLGKFYSTVEKINALMDFGDVGGLRSELHKSRRLCNRKPGLHLEAGAEDCSGGERHADVGKMMKDRSEFDLEYLHLFDGGKWQIYKPGGPMSQEGFDTETGERWKRDKKAEQLVADIIAGKVEDKRHALGKPKRQKQDVGVNL